MATFISSDSLQNYLLNSIFCFQKKFSNLSYYTGTFLQVTIDLGFHFKNYTHVLEYFRFYLLTAVYTKNDTRIFFFYFLSYSDQSKFLFLQTVQSRHNTSYLRTSHFCIKYQHRFLALICLYTLKKIPWKNYVRFWKWNLKLTYQSTQNSISK